MALGLLFEILIIVMYLDDNDIVAIFIQTKAEQSLQYVQYLLRKIPHSFLMAWYLENKKWNQTKIVE